MERSRWRLTNPSKTTLGLYKTKQMSIPVSVLSIQTEAMNYQIGFNPWANPVKNIPLEVQVQRIRLGYSPFSLVARVVIVACIAYWVWREYFGLS